MISVSFLYYFCLFDVYKDTEKIQKNNDRNIDTMSLSRMEYDRRQIQSG